MNINDISAIRRCTSCQLCAAVCPKDAISISLNENGFYRPFIDSNKCVECGVCTKVCYKFDDHISIFDAEKLASTVLYGASVKDPQILASTTSGGIADLLASELFYMGYKCVGVVYDSTNDIAVNKIAETEDQLLSFRGSKYIQSYTVTAFKNIIKNCRKEKFAIFGTPCHIYALDKFMRLANVRNEHILIDLYCHGCPSMHIWTKYIKLVKQRVCQPKFDNANFRSKIRGWGNFYVELGVNGKTVYNSSNCSNEFYELFFSDLLLNDACNNCRLRSTLEYTDIRLGDFWGKVYVLNEKGVSAVSLVSEKAKQLFESIANKIECEVRDYKDFLPWQSWGKEYEPELATRQILLEQLKDDRIPLSDSIDYIHNKQNLKSKLTGYGKKIIKSLPVRFEKMVRWFFYKLH